MLIVGGGWWCVAAGGIRREDAGARGNRRNVGVAEVHPEGRMRALGVSRGMTCDLTCRTMVLKAHVAPAGFRRRPLPHSPRLAFLLG
jgi:hypothetical protein